MNSNYNADEIVSTYADNIFGFCINRLNNIDDAQDLSQEILLEIIRSLPKSNINDINAWVWKIAHNRYARRIYNKKRYITVSLDDRSIIDMLEDDRDFFEIIDNSDEKNAVFSAVHSLAKSHRDILVDYYVNELSYSEIAEKHELSVNTVKTRLFYGRQKLKERWQTIMSENKIYEKINWITVCNGSSIDSDIYLERQIWRAITKAAYEKPLTIEEISEATGIPCMYIEDELPNLLYGEVLTEEKGKYSTNFIIHSMDFLKRIKNLRDKAVTDADLSNRVVKILDKYDKQIRDIGFVGSDRPKNELWWLLIPLVVREAAGKRRSLSGLESPPYPPRKDGGEGWICAYEVEENYNLSLSEDGVGCHSFGSEKNMIQYYTFYKYYSQDINGYFRRTLDIDKSISSTPDIDEKAISDVELAEGIKYKLIEKTANGYKWTFIFFTPEQIKKLEALVAEMANEIMDFSNNLSKALLEIYGIYKKTTPKRLQDQIIGVIGGHLYGSEGPICYALEENGTLAKADSEYFTKSIVIVRR